MSSLPDPFARVAEALALARRFALVIVVGPDSHPHLTPWLLFRALGTSTALRDLAVLPPMVLHDDLDLTELVGDAAPRVIILTEPAQLCLAEREDQLARLNLQRDRLGEFPLRLVYWCTHRGMDELRHVAPDLVHWRSLLIALDLSDLAISTRDDYLAWCLDTFGDERASCHGEDIHLPRDPLVAEFTPGWATIERVTRLSTWVTQQPRGIIFHSSLLSARHLVSPLAHHLALRAVRGEPVPLPVVAEPGELADVARGQLVPSSLQAEPLRWWDAPERALVFVIAASDSAPDTALLARLQDLAAKVFVVTAASDPTLSDDWPRALVAMTLDPFLDADDPVLVAARALADLLDSLFDPRRLDRFIRDEFEGQGHRDLLPRDDDGRWSTRLLRLDNQVTWGPLSRLSERVAAALVTTGRVDAAFFDRLCALRPRARPDIDRVRQLFRRIPPSEP